MAKKEKIGFQILDEVKIVRNGMPKFCEYGKVVDKFSTFYGTEYVVKFEDGRIRRYMESDLKLYNRKVEGLLRWLSK